MSRTGPDRGLVRLSCVLVASVSIHGCADGPESTETPAAPPAVATAPADDVPPEVGPWLDARAQPFGGTHLSLPDGDIGFLREVVGGARIVALGENTRGTRDFFEMKARILRFLVEKMGFRTFAMHVNWPEARRMNRYVCAGEGDPEKLLAGLYRWWWNTESVDAPIAGSFEHYLSGAPHPRFVLDLRDLDAVQRGGSWITEERPFRLIGISYEPATPWMFWFQTPLADWYDVLIHYETTRPSVVLPPRFPDSF